MRLFTKTYSGKHSAFAKKKKKKGEENDHRRRKSHDQKTSKEVTGATQGIGAGK